MDRTALRDDDLSLTELERAFRAGAGVSKPAATAVRIAPQGRAVRSKATETASSTQAEPEKDLSTSIIGSIIEKPSATNRVHGVASVQHEELSTAPLQGAFPEAQHRRQSKFSLARRKGSASAGASTSAANTPEAPADTQRTSTTLESSSGRQMATPAAAAVSSGVDEQSAVREIKEQNDEFISRLTPVEIRQLQEEIQSSMKPEVIAELANRKPPARAPPPICAPNSMHVKPSQPQQRHGASCQAASAPPKPPQPHTKALHAVHAQARAASRAPPAPRPDMGVRSGVAAAAAASLPPLVRTRFSTAGLPVGWVTDEEVARGTSAADVAMRDPLRRDEGAAPAGYSVEEAVLLLAASHPHLQRVGVRVLMSLALRARPQVGELWAQVCTCRSGSEDALTLQQARLAGSGAFTAPGPEARASSSGHRGAQVPWRQMWAHLHHESAVAGPVLQLLQRTATTDRTVRGQALECLSVLVGVPWELHVLLEFSWSQPLLGWPIVAAGALRRSGPAGVWQMAAESVLPEESPNEAADPGLVLENDTVLGLLLLGLLPVLCNELHAAHSATQHAVLRVLAAVVLCGPEAALSVAACKPVLASLREILMNLLEASLGDSQHGDVNANVNVNVNVQLHALWVVRLIVASGGAAAGEVAARGALDMPRAALLSSQWTSAAHHPLAVMHGTEQPQHADRSMHVNTVAGSGATGSHTGAEPSTISDELQVATSVPVLTKVAELSECMRIWRACVLAGVHCVNLDDAMPCVLRLLSWAQTIITASFQPCSHKADVAKTVDIVAGGDLDSSTWPEASTPTPHMHTTHTLNTDQEQGEHVPEASGSSLYVPEASVQKEMKAELAARDSKQDRPGAVAVSTGAPPAYVHARALAAVAVQDIALLLVTLMQCHFPCAAPLQPGVKLEDTHQRQRQLHGSDAASEVSTGASATVQRVPAGTVGNTVTPGCVQQLLPLLIQAAEHLEASGSSGESVAGHDEDWVAARQWLQAHRAAAAHCDAVHEHGDVDRMHERFEHAPPLHPPQYMHACLTMPLQLLRRGAVAACMQAVDAAQAPRLPAGLALIAERGAMLARCMQLPCFQEAARTEASVLEGSCPTQGLYPAYRQAAGLPPAPLLQCCMHQGVTAAMVMVVASLQTRSQHLSQRAGQAVSECAARSVRHRLERSCLDLSKLILCCEGSVMHDSAANAFGAWAAVRVHMMHVLAASLIRTMQIIAALNQGCLPPTLFDGGLDNRRLNPPQGGLATAAAPASTSQSMRAVTRALLLVPCMTASPQLVLQAFQILFSPAILTHYMHISHEYARQVSQDSVQMHAQKTDQEEQQAVLPDTAARVLHAAYAAAWTGTVAAPPPLPASAACGGAAATGCDSPTPQASVTADIPECSEEERSGRIGEPATLELPEKWLEEAAGCGQRLPAPPDWCMLAVATRVHHSQTPAASDHEAAPVTHDKHAPGDCDADGGATAAAVLSAALVWLLGLLRAGVCDRKPVAGEQAGLVEYAWHPRTVLFHALRLTYMTADAALGRNDAHSSIMHAILGSAAISSTMHALLRQLASSPLPPLPTLPASLSQRTTASDIFQRLGRPPPAAQNCPKTSPSHRGFSQSIPVTPASPQLLQASCQIGSSGVVMSEAAGDLAAQFADTSLGDTQFAQALLLLCRKDLGCGGEVWRVLHKTNALHCLPPAHSAIGGAHLYACSAVVALQKLLRQRQPAALSGGSAGEVSDCAGGVLGGEGGVGAALLDGQWSARMLRKSFAAAGEAGVGGVCRVDSLGMGGLLWGYWLLETICNECMASRGQRGSAETRVHSASEPSVVATGVQEGDSAINGALQRLEGGEGGSPLVAPTAAGGPAGAVGESVAMGSLLSDVHHRLVQEEATHAAGAVLCCAVRHAAQRLGGDAYAVLQAVKSCAGGSWVAWGEA